jgi:hypothetical protein
MVAPTSFGITLPSLGSDPSAFWEIFNWEVDRIVWMGILCLSDVVCDDLRSPRTTPMKMEQTQCSETSVIKHHTPGNNPKDYTQYLEHGESLKSRI